MEFYGSIHNHSEYSNFRLRDSINRIPDMVKYAVELKHNFIAITEHETIASALEAQKVEKEIRKEVPDFKVIRGNEIYLCRNGLNQDNFIKGEDKYFHFILLAKDEIGHKQIREISTRAWLRSYKGRGMVRVPTYYQDLIDIIKKNQGHVIGSSACVGSMLGQLLLKYKETNDKIYFEKAKKWIEQIAGIFGKENFFLETQPSNSDEQVFVNDNIKILSELTNFPVVISLDAHYLKKEDAPIHKAFLNSQDGDRETESFYATTYLMSREEIHSYMDSHLGVETVSKWLNNTKLIYDMCKDYDLTKPLRIPYLPRTIDNITYEQYEQFKDKIKNLHLFYNSTFDSDKHLVATIVTKLLQDPEQYCNEETYKEIDLNLNVIWLSSEKQNTRWSAYLLNMRDYIDVIWNEGDSLVGVSRGCFYPNEKVLLYNGTEKNISNIKIGDRVVNHNGQINTVKDIYSYEIEEQCYVIKGKGREPIHCTDNHKFYVKKCSSCDNPSYKNHWCKETCRRAKKCIYEKDHEVGFVPAKDLRIGDLIAYPKPKLQPLNKKYVDLADYIKDDTYVFIEDKVVGYYMGNNRKKKGVEVPRFLPIDEELAYVCGVFIGDGWTRSDEKRQHEIGFAFHSENEKDLNSLKRCEDFFLSLGLKTSKVKHPNRKLIQLHVFSKVLHHFFRKNFGENTYSKHICDWLISSDKKITKALLLGLMASDGHYGKNNICYDSVNKQLIKQVQMLWASIGIYGHYKERIPTNKNWVNSYKWSASGEQLNKLIEDFPLINITSKKWTRQEYLEDEDCFYTPIESINIEQYKGKVYDLNVENIHSYVINGTSVHNSGGGFILLNILGITQINPLKEKTRTFYWRFLNPERVSPLD